MTAALSAAFVSAMASLSDKHKLSPDEMVKCGLKLVMQGARQGDADHTELHLALDFAIMEGAPNIGGAENSLAAIRHHQREAN